MSFRAKPSSSSRHSYLLLVCFLSNYFTYSVGKWRRTDDVKICIEWRNERDEIQTEKVCLPQASLYFTFHLNNETIEYKLKRVTGEPSDRDIPVFTLKEGKLHATDIDEVSEEESGFVSQGEYRSKNSTIFSACYLTADSKYGHQLSGILQLNDTLWAILPLPTQNEANKKESVSSLNEEKCYPHRILKLSSAHSLSFSQRKYIRSKRATPGNKYVIDLGIMTDSTVMDLFLGVMPTTWTPSSPKIGFIIKEYYSFILLIINRIFRNTLTKDFEIKIKCSVLVYSDNSQLSNWAKPRNSSVTNPTIALEEFNKWLAKPQISFLTADHIMLVTRYHINTRPPFLNGYTWKAGLCTGKRISVIRETLDPTFSLAVAQLIAYNIGINFDGVDNACNPSDRFIMSTHLDSLHMKNANLNNAFRLSSCSRNQLRNILKNNTLVRTCMRSSSRLSPLDDFRLMRPGQRYTANEQCSAHFGSASNIYQCEKETFQGRKDLCTNMFCPDNGTCKGIAALEGTSCGTKMWCMNGRCRSHTEAPDISRDCWLGNRNLSVTIADTTYFCKDISYSIGHLCYIDEIREQCCWSCAYFLTNIPDCEYGDRKDDCWDRDCFFYNIKEATHDCCGTCYLMPKTSSANREPFHICRPLVILLLQSIFHTWY